MPALRRKEENFIPVNSKDKRYWMEWYRNDKTEKHNNVLGSATISSHNRFSNAQSRLHGVIPCSNIFSLLLQYVPD